MWIEPAACALPNFTSSPDQSQLVQCTAFIVLLPSLGSKFLIIMRNIARGWTFESNFTGLAMLGAGLVISTLAAVRMQEK